MTTREVSAAVRTSAQSTNLGDSFIELVTISHEGIGDDIRVANNTENITSNGLVYIGYPFEVALPDDIDKPPVGKLRIQNIDREIGAALNRISTPPRVRVQVVVASTPNDIAVNYNFFFLQEITGNVIDISGDLRSYDFSTEAYPAKRGVQSLFPNIFR